MNPLGRHQQNQTMQTFASDTSDSTPSLTPLMAQLRDTLNHISAASHTNVNKWPTGDRNTSNRFVPYERDMNNQQQAGDWLNELPPLKYPDHSKDGEWRREEKSLGRYTPAYDGYEQQHAQYQQQQPQQQRPHQMQQLQQQQQHHGQQQEQGQQQQHQGQQQQYHGQQQQHEQGQQQQQRYQLQQHSAIMHDHLKQQYVNKWIDTDLSGFSRDYIETEYKYSYGLAEYHLVMSEKWKKKYEFERRDNKNLREQVRELTKALARRD